MCHLQVMTDSDFEELAVEARLLRKFKAGKVGSACISVNKSS